MKNTHGYIFYLPYISAELQLKIWNFGKLHTLSLQFWSTGTKTPVRFKLVLHISSKTTHRERIRKFWLKNIILKEFLIETSSNLEQIYD